MFEDDPAEYIRRDLEPSSGWLYRSAPYQSCGINGS